MPNLHLTDMTIRQLKPAGNITYWDTQLSGFGVRVGLKRKTWTIMRGTSRERISFGQYPALPLAEARKRAMVLLGTPNTENAPVIAFNEARRLYLAQDIWREASRYQVERTLTKYFHWQKTLDKITHNDVAQVLGEIGAKSEHAHVLKDIRAFFNWCIPRFLKNNPCDGLKGAPYKPRERVLSNDEIRRVWHAAKKMENYGALIQTLLATGQRVGQFIQFDPAWVKGDIIEFPAEIMKGDRVHQIPLGPLAATILPRLRPMTNQGKRKKELDELSKTTGWTIHDLRRTFATNLAALGTPIHITERLLNHISGTQSGIVAVYQRHDYAKEQREALEAWEKKLQTIVAR